jgi:uncharacterized damage-inducible protein DinB
MPTPYGEYVTGRDPLDVLRESFEEYRRLGARLTPELWDQPLAPGKWTVRQVLVHVVQWEMIFGLRLRFAVASPDYVIQPFEQDPLMGEADVVDGPTALAAFEAVRKMTLDFAASLTPAQRRQRTVHADRGDIDVEDVLTTLAGHAVHHLRQVQAVTAA